MAHQALCTFMKQQIVLEIKTSQTNSKEHLKMSEFKRQFLPRSGQ